MNEQYELYIAVQYNAEFPFAIRGKIGYCYDCKSHELGNRIGNYYECMNCGSLIHYIPLLGYNEMTRKVGEVFYCEKDECEYKVVGTDPTKKHPDAGHPSWKILVRKVNPETGKTEGPLLEYESKGSKK